MLSWKVYVKSPENLRRVLNLLVVGRETELTIMKGSSLMVAFSDSETGDDVSRVLKDSMGNVVEPCECEFSWKDNVFLTNRPRHSLFTIFPFLVETSMALNSGDRLFISVERFSTHNPLKMKALGMKGREMLYRVRIFTPVLIRRYFSRNGKQCITLHRGYPMILTDAEIVALINGDSHDGLLAI